MIQRQRLPHRSGKGRERSAPPPPPVISLLPEYTVPLPPVPPAGEDDESAILGFPAESESDDGAQQLAARLPDVPPSVGDAGYQEYLLPAHPGAAGQGSVHLVIVRRSERLGGVALLLAGVAADVSLWLPWFRGTDATGLTLVRQGLVVLRSGIGALGRSGLWGPVVVVLAGGVLFLLGLVLFRRARSHRPAGLIALCAALAAATAVVVPLADADWSVASFGPGMWTAVAVALLGVLGALKAMLTAPVVSAERVWSTG